MTPGGTCEQEAFTEEQIAYALLEADSGLTVGEVCREVGVSQNTFYTLRRKYAGMEGYRPIPV